MYFVCACIVLVRYFSIAKERKSKLSLIRKKKAGGAQTTSKKTISTTELPEQAYVSLSRDCLYICFVVVSSLMN